MKKSFIASILILSTMSFGANAAQMITKAEAKHFQLVKVGTISIDSTGKNFSLPSDLQNEISKKVDAKGGKYYVITSARESGDGLAGTVTIYK